MPAPDALLFDFSDSDWHFTLAGAVQMANTYPNTPAAAAPPGIRRRPRLLPLQRRPRKVWHDLITNPQRIHILAPGEPYTLNPINR